MRRIHLNLGKLFSGRRGIAACLVLAAMIFGMVNLPWAAGVAATTRQLPIYCVQRDQKVVSISFTPLGVMLKCGSNPLRHKGLRLNCSAQGQC